ncbi:Rieske 2Fe-2S domain-containing protein [Pseudomonas lini]
MVDRRHDLRNPDQGQLPDPASRQKNPIIVIRGADGVVHAFHNVCRHRGSRLCTSEKKAKSPNWSATTTSGRMSWTVACCSPAPKWAPTST